MGHLVPHHLGFNHISKLDIIDLHKCSSAIRLPKDQADHAIKILDGTYVCFQKSANNLLEWQTFSLHKGKPLVKPMLVVTATDYIISCMELYSADYKNDNLEITKHIMYNNKEQIGEWLKKSDIVAVDHGIGDALDHLRFLVVSSTHACVAH